MTYPTIPTAHYRTIAVALVPAHRKGMLCVATHIDHLQPMRDALAEYENYRLSIQSGTVRSHEVKERGVVRTWVQDHRPVDREDRLRELEAKADRFEPMEEVEWSKAA